MITTIYIGEWRVDQFDNENVSVVSRVLDITNITKNEGDFTKSFTVPASKRNNILFRHWYDATLNDGFDARIRVSGRIELDGFLFKKGKWRLSKVSVKKGSPSSYTINFFGNLPSLKDILKKDLLSDLDLSAFNHDYDSDNVKAGLRLSSFFQNDLIYTLLPKKRYFYDSSGDDTQTPLISNIAAGGGTSTGVVWNDLRPSIKLIKIIEAIENKFSGKQITKLEVIDAANFGTGSCFLTLNGTQHEIDIFTTTEGGNALEVNNFVNALPDYSSTVSGRFITIVANDIGLQSETLWAVNTATGMDVVVGTSVFGSNSKSIVFSRDFFGTSEFTNLYMWLNPDADREPGGETNVVNWDSGSSLFMNLTTDIGSYPVFDSTNINDRKRYDIFCFVFPEPGFEGIEYTIIAEVDGEDNTVTQHTGDDSQLLELDPDADEDATRSVRWKVSSEQEFEYTAKLFQRQTIGFFPPTITEVDTFASNVQIIDSVFVVSEEFPKIKIIDFLKGLFNMFKLVIVAQDDGTYFVDTLNSYYDAGELYDVTKYIHFDSFDVERGIILNEIELKFKEPTTLLNIQFEKNNNRFYGDIEKTLEDEDGELLDGDTLTFELPFEQIVYERLTDQNNNALTNIQYGAIIDEDLEPANPKAHIFYGVSTNINASPISFIDDVGTRTTINGYIWTTFHHHGMIQPNFSTIFNREFSTWDGVAIDKTLYLNHYDEYVSNIFNIKKRTFKYTAQLPVHIITKLELNDTLRIKGDYYRIDKYSYNLLTSKTDFNLINNFESKINPLRTPNNSINVDFRIQVETIPISNSSGAIPTLIDQGFGTSWIVLSTTGNNLNLTFALNDTDVDRALFLQISSGVEVINIYVSQTNKQVTFDSTTVTFDSTLITFDNT